MGSRFGEDCAFGVSLNDYGRTGDAHGMVVVVEGMEVVVVVGFFYTLEEC
jgi:hypothetical protein